MAAIGYHARYNPDLLNLIPPDAKTVLEIGCGEGALCEAYRRINPGVEWHGIEPNEDICRIARDKMKSAHPVTAEAWLGRSVDPQSNADCLVLGDCLEHLVDPWSVLKKLVDHMRPGAQVLASIPNAANWRIILSLLKGDFPYEDEGLFDRSHLRWFCLKNMLAMFKDAGLEVFDVMPRYFWLEEHGVFMAAIKEGFCKVDRGRLQKMDEDALYKRTAAVQYIVRAVKPKGDHVRAAGHWEGDKWSPEPLHIHAVTAEACCARPRIHEPFAMLATIPGTTVSTETYCTDSWNHIPVYVDSILILQRTRVPRDVFIADVRSCLEERPKCIIIAEIDDHPEAIGMDPMDLRAVHAVQCSTEAIAEICRKYNPNVMVFPNQIKELPAWEDKPERKDIRIFYGAQNRRISWEPIMPALNRVLEANPKITVEVIHDQEFYEALDASSPRKLINKAKANFTPFCEYSEYRRILRSCDITLLPLEDTPFNKCKSDLKFLECAGGRRRATDEPDCVQDDPRK